MTIIDHQSFTIALPVYIRKHLMIIVVNTSHQNFEIKNGCGEHIVITATYNKNNFTHFLLHKHQKNPLKSSQKIKITRTHDFVNQRSYQNISPINRQKHFLVATL